MADDERILVNGPLGSSNTLLVDSSDGVTSGFSRGLKNFSMFIFQLRLEIRNHMAL